eukprot:1180901-Prorocentrum_minimum.AAC.1
MDREKAPKINKNEIAREGSRYRVQCSPTTNSLSSPASSSSSSSSLLFFARSLRCRACAHSPLLAQGGLARPTRHDVDYCPVTAKASRGYDACVRCSCYYGLLLCGDGYWECCAHPCRYWHRRTRKYEVILQELFTVQEGANVQKLKKACQRTVQNPSPDHKIRFLDIKTTHRHITNV